MLYTNYKNFSIDTEYPIKKIITSNDEQIFFFTQTSTIIEKYLYKNIKKNNVSLTSTQDGDPTIFFVNGDYEVPAGTTLSPTNRCKGLYMFINGTLTINGAISMTARGAKAEGRYINIDPYGFLNPTVRFNKTNVFKDLLEWVGDSTATPTNANSINGTTNNCCGSGGAGGVQGASQGRGGNGTSFSGGAGGGGACFLQNGTGVSGAANGGAGGAGRTSSYRTAGGGAGNPGGAAAGHPTLANSKAGENGTGGLLIIIAKSIINNGSIVSQGSKGGLAGRSGTAGDSGSAGGGGSGGGSIILFYSNFFKAGTISVAGGSGGAGSTAPRPGIAGGNGTYKAIKIDSHNLL